MSKVKENSKLSIELKAGPNEFKHTELVVTAPCQQYTHNTLT